MPLEIKYKENEWKKGHPLGKMTAENKQWFLDTYEVYFAPMQVWHREKAAIYKFSQEI